MFFYYLLILAVLAFIYLFWPLYVRLTESLGAPFVPSEPRVVAKMLKMADVKRGDSVYDLGSGDGRVVIAAALMGAKAYGVEISLLKVIYSRIWVRVLGLQKNAKIIHANLFNADLNKADVVIVFLTQEANDRLSTKLSNELKKDAKIVSYAFDMEGFKRKKININLGAKYGPLYLYTKE
jgi:protein-L-isoaspartate O-methyltransferase